MRRFILQSCMFWSITNYTIAVWRKHPKMQTSQFYILLISGYQLRWGEPNEWHHHFSTNDRSSHHRSADTSSPEHHTWYHCFTSTPPQIRSLHLIPSSMMIPPKKTSQQLHLMMMFGLKIQYWRDSCVFMTHHSQITSVPAHIQT